MEPAVQLEAAKPPTAPALAESPAPAEVPAPVQTAPIHAAPQCFADMRLRVGDRAQLEPPSQTGAGRIPVTIVGWVESEALIATVPLTRMGRLTLQKGEHVLLRVFTGSSAYAFKCSVLKPSRPPFEYLHLSFPDRVEALEVRKSPRYRVDFPATVIPAGRSEPVDARFENISATGALIRSTESLGAASEQIRLDFGFELHGVPVKLSLAATLLSVKNAEDTEGGPYHLHGIEFGSVAPNDQLLLHALVWYEMHANPRNAM